MAQGVTGYFDIAGTLGVTARVHYAETYDVLQNTSVLQITALQIKNTEWYGYTYYLDGSISVNGAAVVSPSSVSGNLSVTVDALDTFASAGGVLAPPWASGQIVHNTDGSRSVTVAVSLRGYTTSGEGGSGWRVEGSTTVALTTIPRASTVGAADTNIGATSILAINRKSPGYTHTITYVFGGLSGTICTKSTDTTIAWTVPAEFYTQIPNAKSGVCTLYCRTYSGDTQIGDTQTATFVATAAEAACRPEVSGTVTDSNEATAALTGDSSRLVRYMSTALCTISATPKNSATIAQKVIAGETVTGDSRTIPAVEVGSFVFSATDSRGYTGSASVTVDVVPYVKLTCNLSATRNGSVSGDAKLRISGNYYSGSFGAADNALTVQYRVAGGEWVEVTPALTGDSYAVNVGLTGLDYRKAFNIEVRVADKLAQVRKSTNLDAAIPGFYWGKSNFSFQIPVEPLSGMSALRYNGASDSNEERFNAYLTEALPDTPDAHGVILPISFCVYPAISGQMYEGFVSVREGRKWGGILAWSYNGTLLHKELQNGVWQPAVLSRYDGDSVYDVGTSGIWRYRRWESGLAECWGQFDTTGGTTVTLPFTMADANYTVTYAFTNNGQAVKKSWIGGWDGKNGKNVAYFPLIIQRESGHESTSIRADFVVRGRWK